MVDLCVSLAITSLLDSNMITADIISDWGQSVGAKGLNLENHSRAIQAVEFKRHSLSKCHSQREYQNQVLHRNRPECHSRNSSQNQADLFSWLRNRTAPKTWYEFWRLKKSPVDVWLKLERRILP